MREADDRTRACSSVRGVSEERRPVRVRGPRPAPRGHYNFVYFHLIDIKNH